MDEQDILKIVDNHYFLKIYKAFNNNPRASEAATLISQQLTDDIYNFIEPAFFDFKFIVFKTLDDRYILPREKGSNIKMNKAVLKEKNTDIVIQVFENRNIVLWENIDYDGIFLEAETLIYQFENNSEKFIANKIEIEIPSYGSGSFFSGEFSELETHLGSYKLHKIKHSSCPLFNRSWMPDNKILFIGGGKDIPEKYMQESLHNFISDLGIFKGNVGQLESEREHNLNANYPVDIIVRWEKSNRIALIEIKWLGKSIYDGKIRSNHSNSRAIEGYEQLKKYYDLAKKDNPNKLIKCYLIVIDGRRRSTKPTTKTISQKHGMYYEHKEIELPEGKKFYNEFKSIAKPIRMFAEPICTL